MPQRTIADIKKMTARRLTTIQLIYNCRFLDYNALYYRMRKISVFFDVCRAFIVAGCIGIVQYRLGSGMRQSPELPTDGVEQILLNGVPMLETEKGNYAN